MAISWLTENKLWPLLDGGLIIAIANAADSESTTQLIGAIVALHSESGEAQIRRSTELSLAAGESFPLMDNRPLQGGTVGVEAILRVVAPESQVIAEIYLHSDETRTTPIEAIEVGIMSGDNAPATASVPIPEIDGLSAYLKLVP